MEKYLLNSPAKSDDNMLSLMAEKVLNKALHDFREAKLREEIDKTLISGNKEDFMRLTKELKELLVH